MISRRAFMKAGSLALVSLGADPLFVDRAAYALRHAGGRARGRTLVCLFQRGAVDGLSMVVPVADPAYWTNRRRIAIARPELLALDGQFALHPRLAPLRALWDRKQLAIVHAVGSPSLTRSHFDAQDFMETGAPDQRSTTDGWANRYCQNPTQHADTPFRSVAFGAQLPRTLAGSAPALAIKDLRTFGLREAREDGDRPLTTAFESLYGGNATGLVASSAAEGFEAIRMLRVANPANIGTANGAEYPRGELGSSMRQVAQLIRADLGVEIAFVDVGGWDTHVNQGAAQGQLATRLNDLGAAIGAFVTDLGDRMADVALITMSEFGRTVRENGTGGTDHGHGTAMFVIGGDVRGGAVHGNWPGLGADALHEGRDLAVTTDFRTLFSEVLQGHLGAVDLKGVFPGFTGSPTLGVYPSS
ncbi:MAG: DUF1501 domain-containing protein [Gemmatimonadales bacterium]|nr:DUF1501 domain-containing protein [Gemmatimonadales bacterium]